MFVEIDLFRKIFTSGVANCSGTVRADAACFKNMSEVLWCLLRKGVLRIVYWSLHRIVRV